MKKGPNPMVFLIMALATFVLGGGMVFMQYSSLTAQSGRVEALRKDQKDEKAVRAELDNSQRQLDEAVSKLSHLEQGVTEKAYIPTMLKELELVGKQHGIEVTGVRPMPAPPKPEKEKDGERKTKKAYHELLIEVKGRGVYGDVMRFMDVLQSFPKIVAVRTVSLSPPIQSGTRRGGNKLDVTVELKAYAFPPTKEQTPPATPAMKLKVETGQPGAAQAPPAVEIIAPEAPTTVEPASTPAQPAQKTRRKWKKVRRNARR